jgi:PAS domain-containing protein
MIGVHVDIHERKQAEEKLRESETALRMAQRVAQIGSWQLDIDSGTPALVGTGLSDLRHSDR